jgi:ATP-dependent protease ClpP protease subunit
MKFSYRTEHNAKAIAALWGKPINGNAPYTVKALSGDATELWIMDVLGWPWNDINSMIREVSSLKEKELLVRLNSPGGDPIDTFALYHALKNHSAKVTVRIEALAASAASFLALAGNEVQAYSSSLMMIHNSWVVTSGNRFELQDTADVLEKIDDNMRDIYVEKSKMGKKEVADMMKAETWLSAKEAKDKGFVNTILDGKPVKAAFDLSIFSNLPDEFKPESNKKPLTEREIERAIRDVFGLSENRAKTIISKCKKEDEVEADNSAELAEVIAAAKNFVSKMTL